MVRRVNNQQAPLYVGKIAVNLVSPIVLSNMLHLDQCQHILDFAKQVSQYYDESEYAQVAAAFTKNGITRIPNPVAGDTNGDGMYFEPKN